MSAPGVDDVARARFGLATAELVLYGVTLPPKVALQRIDRAAEMLAAAGVPRDAYWALYLQATLTLRANDLPACAAATRQMRAREEPGWTIFVRRRRRLTDAMLASVTPEVPAAHRHQAYARLFASELALSRREGWQSESWSCAHGLAYACAHLGQLDEAIAALSDAVQEIRAAGLLRQHATLAAQHATLRLVRDGDGEARALAFEAAQLLAADSALWWSCDAWALLAAREGRWADAWRLAAWADGVVKAQAVKERGPVMASTKSAFERLMAAAPDGTRPEGAESPPLDDAQVLALTFGVGVHPVAEP